MYYLKAESSFDAAHFLSGYQGKCKNIHGHRWRVVVEIFGKELETDGQTRGMVRDFGELKRDVRFITDAWDHSFIYEVGSLKEKTILALKEEEFRLIEVAFRPTAENFSRYFFEQMQEKGYLVYQVAVYETPNNCAVYRKENAEMED